MDFSVIPGLAAVAHQISLAQPSGHASKVRSASTVYAWKGVIRASAVLALDVILIHNGASACHSLSEIPMHYAFRVSFYSSLSFLSLESITQVREKKRNKRISYSSH